MEQNKAEIYTTLAEIYDTLMEDVDYESWADFIDEIMQTHHPDPVEILEMGCGTGSLSLSLAELECYNITGTDLSPHMIKIARNKAGLSDADVEFFSMNFLNIQTDHTYDCIYSVFDSVNYLKSPDDVKQFLISSYDILNPGGLLIFDFSTPKNSLEAVDHLNNEEGDAGEFRYFRNSNYDPSSRIHTNHFEIEQLDKETGEVINTFEETHEQRAYLLDEMLSIVKQTPYHLVAKYDGFDLIDADDNSTRVTMVLRCQIAQ